MKEKEEYLSKLEELFCQKYSEEGILGVSYMSACQAINKKVTKSSANVIGSALIKDQRISSRVREIQLENANALKITRTKMITDLNETAEQAKTKGQFGSYTKLKELIIKMLGYNATVVTEHKTEFKISFGTELPAGSSPKNISEGDSTGDNIEDIDYIESPPKNLNDLNNL